MRGLFFFLEGAHVAHTVMEIYGERAASQCDAFLPPNSVVFVRQLWLVTETGSVYVSFDHSAASLHLYWTHSPFVILNYSWTLFTDK